MAGVFPKRVGAPAVCLVVARVAGTAVVGMAAAASAACECAPGFVAEMRMMAAGRANRTAIRPSHPRL